MMETSSQRGSSVNCPNENWPFLVFKDRWLVKGARWHVTGDRWQVPNYDYITISDKSHLLRTTWHLDNRWNVFEAAICDLAMFYEDSMSAWSYNGLQQCTEPPPHSGLIRWGDPDLISVMRWSDPDLTIVMSERPSSVASHPGGLISPLATHWEHSTMCCRLWWVKTSLKTWANWSRWDHILLSYATPIRSLNVFSCYV